MTAKKANDQSVSLASEWCQRAPPPRVKKYEDFSILNFPGVEGALSVCDILLLSAGKIFSGKWRKMPDFGRCPR